jgi:hypothetical protein
MYKVTEVDCQTGIETIRDLTPEEIAVRESFMAEQQSLMQAQEAEATAKAQAKASAIAKLSALGLSEEEISAITN